MVRLQHALAVTPDQQLAGIPPSPVRMRELEEENMALHREIESLRRQLEARNARLRPDIAPRGLDTPPLDTRAYERDYRQRAFGCDDLQTQTVGFALRMRRAVRGLTVRAAVHF